MGLQFLELEKSMMKRLCKCKKVKVNIFNTDGITNFIDLTEQGMVPKSLRNVGKVLNCDPRNVRKFRISTMQGVHETFSLNFHIYSKLHGFSDHIQSKLGCQETLNLVWLISTWLIPVKYFFESIKSFQCYNYHPLLLMLASLLTYVVYPCSVLLYRYTGTETVAYFQLSSLLGYVSVHDHLGHPIDLPLVPNLQGFEMIPVLKILITSLCLIISTKFINCRLHSSN